MGAAEEPRRDRGREGREDEGERRLDLDAGHNVRGEERGGPEGEGEEPYLTLGVDRVAAPDEVGPRGEGAAPHRVAEHLRVGDRERELVLVVGMPPRANRTAEKTSATPAAASGPRSDRTRSPGRMDGLALLPVPAKRREEWSATMTA